jgi:sec-independent protein translocase protein TatC
MATEKLPFMSHLSELRNRIVVLVVTILVGFLAAFHFSEHIFRVLTLPMRANLSFRSAYPYIYFAPKENTPHELVFLAPAEAFWVHLKIALITAVIAAVPVIFWQVWRFISPGLLRKEKRLAVPFVGVTTGLFLTGTSFCFIIVIPFAIKFLLNFRTESLTPMISVEKYIDFCLKFILAFGVVFELPVVMVFLTRMGIITPETLAKNRKYSVLLAFVAAALLTPTPDAFNQTLMAVPIIVLYEGGLLASKVFLRRKKKKEKEGTDDTGKKSESNSL